jgi:hypothetical protein
MKVFPVLAVVLSLAACEKHTMHSLTALEREHQASGHEGNAAAPEHATQGAHGSEKTPAPKFFPSPPPAR